MKNYSPTFVGFSQEEQKTIYKTEFHQDSVECYDKDYNLVYFEAIDDDGQIEWEKWTFDKDNGLFLEENSDGEIVKYIYNGGLEIRMYTNSDNEWQIKFYKKGEMLNGCGNEIFKISHYGIYEMRDFETFKNLGDGFFINKKEV